MWYETRLRDEIDSWGLERGGHNLKLPDFVANLQAWSLSKHCFALLSQTSPLSPTSISSLRLNRVSSESLNGLKIGMRFLLECLLTWSTYAIIFS